MGITVAREERFWTEERVEQLKKLVLDEIPYRKIAKQMGCKNGAISGKVDRLARKGEIQAPGRDASRARASKPKIVPPKRLPTTKSSTATSGAKINRLPQQQNASAEIMAESRSRVIALDAARDRSTLTSFVELEDIHCRYPYGEPSVVGYCGHDKVPGKSWCPEHLALCEPTAALKMGFRITESKTAEVPAPVREMEDA